MMGLRAELLAFLEGCDISLPEDFDDDTQLLSSGMLDSLALFNLVLWIEERTGGSIDPTQMDIVHSWDSVRRILRYIGAEREAPVAAIVPGRGGALPGQVRVVPYTPEHKDAVAIFQTGLWSPDVALNRRYLEWKHEENPYVVAPRAYLAIDNGELVGMRSFYPSRWQVGRPTREVDILVADDLLVREDRRDEGIVSAMMRAAFDDLRSEGAEYVFNLTGGPVTVLGSLAMGWRSAGFLDGVGLRSQAQRWRVSVRERMKSMRFAWRYADSPRLQAGIERYPFQRLDTRAGALLPGDMQLEVSATPRVEEMAALIERVDYDGRLRHVRDAMFLEWRFRHPFNEYRFIYAGGTPLDGFLVLKWSGARGRANLRVQIVDLEAVDERVSAALLEAAVKVGHFPELVTWRATLSPSVTGVLDRLGFEPVDRERATHGWPCVLVRSIDDTRLDEDWALCGTRLLDLSSWDMRMLYTMAG